MSDLRMNRLAISAAVALLGARGAGAQSLSAYESRLAGAMQDVRAARTNYSEYKKNLDERQQFRDTVRVGMLRVLTTPSISPLVREAATIASKEILEQVGKPSAMLEGRMLWVRPQTPGKLNAEAGPAVMTGYINNANGDEVSQTWATQKADVIAPVLKTLALRLLSDSLDPSYRQWAGADALPVDNMTPLGWSSVRVQLVSAPASLARTCYDGDLAACKKMLGLTPTTDQLSEWYTPEDRRNVVRNTMVFRGGAPGTPAVKKCLEGSDADCNKVIRGHNLGWGQGAGRSSLVRQALTMGGKGALERLVTTPGSPADRLSAAANAPIDNVVEAWRKNVHDVRVPSDTMSSGMALMSAAWILVFAGLSMRSPRWR
jgi:hypothetical protein